MAPSTPRQVRVRVPATTANLGSGFDVMGLALQLYNVFTMTVTTEPGWRVRLPPGVRLPTRGDNLVFRTARRLFTHIGMTPPGLHLALTMDIPLSRGLGSSSSAIIGGLLAANHLTGNTLSREALLALAVEIEGHPDNVTPALMGGLTLSYTAEGRQQYLSLPFPEELTLVVAIPDFPLPTAQARAQSDESHMLKPFSGSAAPLAISAGVGIVFGDDGNTQPLLKLFLKVYIPDAGDVWGCLDHAGLGVSEPRNANTDGNRGVGLQLGNKAADRRNELLEVVRRSCGPCRFRDSAEGINPRSLDVGSANVDPDIVHSDSSSLV